MTLYERILGDEFSKLSPLVQKMHRYEGVQVLRGEVQILRGKSFVAKLLNVLMKLPKEQRSTSLMLELKEEKHKELWTRTFGSDTFTSTQYQSSNQMVERMGLIKMYFDVYVEDASLCTVLKKTTVLGLTVPKILTVKVSSKAKEEEGKLLFTVKVETFGAKQVIDYDGVIKL